MSGQCCAPSGGDRSGADVGPVSRAVDPEASTVDLPMVQLPGGAFWMGSEAEEANAGDGEGPVREVHVSPFQIGQTAVTNDQFAAFVSATGYVTGAERYGWSYVFASFLPGPLRKGPRPPAAPWWCAVPGARWDRPEGPDSSVEERADHPVVHIDHGDALAFCAWSGTRLPTEAEWEYAARGGLDRARYAWGEDLLVDGEHRCNIWQGKFPMRNTGEDGYAGTAPVRSFPPNGFGLYEVSGNVWEWIADWWGVGHSGHAGQVRTDPQGPDSGTARVMRGGSYLCHDSYCNRYRVAARTSNDPDSASGNLGFRLARSVGT